MDLDLFEKVKHRKPKSILLIGKGASGKSYTAKQLANLGYNRVSIDHIIRDMMIARKVDSNMPYLFKWLYGRQGPEYPEETKEFLGKLRMAIKNGPVVFDGMLMPQDIQLLGIEMLAIVVPESPRTYADFVKVRFEKDIKEGIASMGCFWSYLDDEAKEDLEGERYKAICTEFKHIGWTGRFDEALGYVMKDLERSVEDKKERYVAFNPHVHVNRIE